MNRAIASAMSFAVICSCAGCGVKGRPQPPLTPAELGRGQPNFRRATEEFAFPNVPSPDSPTPTPTPRPTPSAY